MARTRSGKRQLEAELDALMSSLDLTERERQYMDDRWRPQVVAAQRRVDSNRQWYYGWRVPTMVGALLLPALASPTVAAPWARWTALGVSLVVAVSTALESTFRFGNRWRLYRRLLQELRAEGWAYAYGRKPYTSSAGFALFVERSEDAVRRYSEAYVADILVLGPSEPPSAQPQTATP